MDVIFLIFLIILGFGLLVGIPILFSVLSYRWLRKKGHEKLGLAIGGLVIVALVFWIYIAFYPLDSFYKEDFEYYSKLTFPPSGRIISKEASYPDIHGKYSSDAVVELSKADYSLLLRKLGSDSTFKADTVIGYASQYFEKVTIGIAKKDIIQIVRKSKLNIGFHKDKRTIIIERRMW